MNVSCVLILYFIVFISFNVLLCSADLSLNDNQFYVVNSADDYFDNLIVEPKSYDSVKIQDVIKRHKRYAIFNSEAEVETDLKSKVSSPSITTLEIEDWILLLEENEYFSFGKRFEEEWISNENSETNHTKKEEKTNCKFYTGIVLYEIDSKAIMTICDKNNYYGFFTAAGRSYFVEPTTHPLNGHIVYKAKVPKSQDELNKEKFNPDDFNYANNFTDGNASGTKDANKNGSDNPIKTKDDGKNKRTFYVEEDVVDLNGKINKRKRCIDCDNSGGFNLTGDTLFDGNNYNFGEEDDSVYRKKLIDDAVKKYSENPENRTVRHYRKHDEDEVGYFIDTAWETRPYPQSKSYQATQPTQERWLEIALAVDYTVIEFHGKDRIRQYIMALMNIVSAIYKDPSLDANLHLVMARLIFYDDKKDSQVKKGNAKRSLEAVNRWNYKLLGKLGYDDSSHDVAVWLTREYIGGPSGYAPVAGACDRSRSTALNKDEGLASAFIIAHEMAHILGLTHDGDEKAGNQCYDEVGKGTIMAPTVTATFHRFSWSSCSKKEFHRLIKQWTCLMNPPKGKNLTYLTPGATNTFTMDEQCRMEYGDGYSLCKSFELIEPCTHLWCGNQNSSLYCITKKGPPVEGTQCGFDKWCVDGYCQSIDSRIGGRPTKPRPGGWSPWSPWSACSRTCGYGVQRRVRRCDSPTPELGGDPCVGETEEALPCRQDKNCAKSAESDARAEFCNRLTGHWLPYDTEEEDMLCRVVCIKWDSGEVMRSGELLPDGTPCSYDNEHHICINGNCHRLGCDGIENSTLTEDSCGVCGGHDNTCTNTNLKFAKTIKKDLTRLVNLPRTSRHVRIRVTFHSAPDSNQIVAHSLFHLAVRDKSKRLYRMMARNFNDQAQFLHRAEPENQMRAAAGSAEGPAAVLAGAALRATRPPGALTLAATGPLGGDLVIMVSSPEEYVNTVEMSVEVNYTVKTMSNASPLWRNSRFIWDDDCTCNSDGTATPNGKCLDTQRENRTSHPSRCPTHNELERKCSEYNCMFRWAAGDWEYCSATCGEMGISLRQIYCVPLSVDNSTSPADIWRYMVEPNRCSENKSDESKSCNRIPCPAYWTEGNWTPCSSSCGPGISTRPLNCSGDDCGQRPPARWRRCRGRCGGLRERRHCNKDRSKYCELAEIARYCILPTFERLCCRSCAGVLGDGNAQA